MSIAIKVEHLSKSYIIRHKNQLGQALLRDVIAEKINGTIDRSKNILTNKPSIKDQRDRKSVVQGKSVDLGGRRIIKKNVYTKNENAIILIGLFFFKQKTAYEITR